MALIEEQNGRTVQPRFLDMLPIKPQSQEEVKSLLHKLAELKLRPEKLPDDEDVVHPLSCKNIKDFPYLDPVPSTMLHVNIRDLSSVNIDWKMLTLDRPETQLEINIFSRMVYLDKLMTRDINVEKKKKEKEKYIRLRTKGKWKPPTDSDGDKSDEFTYEYFSRFSGFNEGAEAMEEISKPKTPEDAKPRPVDTNETQLMSKTPVPAQTHRNKRLRTKKKLRRKKRKKKSKKSKLRKHKPPTRSKVDQRIKKFRSLIASSRNKPKKSKTLIISKKKTPTPAAKMKKKPDSNKTLIQMLKTSEQQDKKKSESSQKSKSPVQSKKTDD